MLRIFNSTRCCAFRHISAARTTTDVVPSPHSLSWVFEMLMRIFAAGLSIHTDFRIVAPSFVTMTWFRLQDFVHALRAECGLHEVPDRDGTDEGLKSRILAPVLRCLVRENAGRPKELVRHSAREWRPKP